MTDEQIIAELVRVKRVHPEPGLCALAALARAQPINTGWLLTHVAFHALGVSVATSFGIMVGWDGPDSAASFGRTQQHSPADFARGVAIGQAVRAAVQS